MCFITSERGILILDGTTRLSRMSPTPSSKKAVIQAPAQRLLLAVLLPRTATGVEDSHGDTTATVGTLMSVRFQSRTPPGDQSYCLP